MAAPVSTSVNVKGGATQGEFDLTSYLPIILEKFIAVMGAVLIMAGAVLAIRILRSRIRKIEIEHDQQRNAINLLEKITSGFIVVVGITLSLKIVGIDMTLLVSVAILGLSYGLQDIIKNYVAGILILFKAPFKIGEVVKIRDFTGKVLKMDFQATTLETFDNRHITIYNSDVMTQSIVNYSNNTMRRLEFDVSIGYGSDISSALQIFNKILQNYEKVLKKPKFSVVFKKFTDVGITFTLKFWVARPCNILKIRTDIAAQIHQSFDESKVYMPYSKGIEGDNEEALTQITEAHKQRNADFFNQPFFTQPLQPIPVQITEGVAPPPLVGPDGQPLSPEAHAAYYEASETPDYEEPE